MTCAKIGSLSQRSGNQHFLENMWKEFKVKTFQKYLKEYVELGGQRYSIVDRAFVLLFVDSGSISSISFDHPV